VASVVERTVAGVGRLRTFGRKLRVLATPPSRKVCETCTAFDPAGVQEVLGRHPAFATAAQWLEPSAMAGPVEDMEEASSPDAPKQAIKWGDAGVCGAHSELRFKTDGCSRWTPR